MDEDLISRLKQDAEVAAIARSVSWVSRPKKEDMPGLTLERISPGRTYTFKGASRLQDTLVRFNFWGLAARDIKPLFGATLTLLERPATVGNTDFGMTFLEGERDFPAEEVPGIGTVFRLGAEFRIWWKPS
ncbi:MAG: hypothetical protein QM605_13495 [Sphingobium sp.]